MVIYCGIGEMNLGELVVWLLVVGDLGEGEFGGVLGVVGIVGE